MIKNGEIMSKFAFLVGFKEKFKNLFSDKKKSFIFVFVAIVVVGVLLVSSYFETDSSKKQIENESDFSILEYSNNIEKKLQAMILSVEEIESASVMVMVESTPKISYLTEGEETIETDEKGSSSTKSTTVVFEKNGSVYAPIVVTTLMPKVTGVLIVVNNISASTKHSLLNSVAVVLNIDVSSISILQKN